MKSMIILISPETNLPNELDILDKLFHAGLQYYHLRKPEFNRDQHKHYLKQIKPEFLKRIMLHNHHELAEDFLLKGIHLEESKWREQENGLASYVSRFKEKGYTVSSSYHEMEDLAAQPVVFDYYMLSPVFGAISKPGYKGRGFKVSHIPKTIVGMGGINASTTQDALALGFKGVGTLGGIWNAKDPIKAFTAIKDAILNQ